MNISKHLCLLFLLCFFVNISHQECIHDHLNTVIEDLPDEEADPEGHANNRVLAANWGPLRIYADFTHFSGSSTNKNYIKNSLLEPAFDFFASALKVQQMTKLSTSSSSLCGLSVPSTYRSGGVAADLVLFVTGETASSNWVAWAQPCQTLSSTGRAIFGQINFNFKYVTAGSSRGLDANLMTTMHEMTHVLGFSQSLFGKFLNKPKQGYKSLNGVSTPYIDIGPLTEKVRSHFGCSTGVAFLENQGGSGSAGSHFERRTFANEYMTASAIPDLRITKFTLALLESSGWYQVDYNYADSFNWGKGDGCSFLTGACKGRGFSEFCSTSGASGCTYQRAFGASCSSSDSFGDGCPYYKPYSNHDCSDPGSSGRAVISGEYYGPGSKCFTGTLYNGGSVSKRPYCLKYQCEKSADGNYAVKFILGSKTASCTASGSLKVSGYSGYIDCPEPNVFCKGVGLQTCKRGCMGRGQCQADGSCKCNPGFSGANCLSGSGQLNYELGNEINNPEAAQPASQPADTAAPADDNADPNADNADNADNGDWGNWQEEPMIEGDVILAPPFNPATDVIPDGKDTPKNP